MPRSCIANNIYIHRLLFTIWLGSLHTLHEEKTSCTMVGVNQKQLLRLHGYLTRHLKQKPSNSTTNVF